jgi:hypothetical protein
MAQSNNDDGSGCFVLMVIGVMFIIVLDKLGEILKAVESLSP